MYEMRVEDPKTSAMTGTLWIRSQPICILFDSGSTHSFISELYFTRLGLDCAYDCEPFITSLADGDKLVGTKEIRGCPIYIGDRDWGADLTVIDIHHYDVILGMD